MKKEKGIGLVAFIIIFVAILIIGAVAVVLLMAGDKDKDNEKTDDKVAIKDSNTKTEVNIKEDKEEFDVTEWGVQESIVSGKNDKLGTAYIKFPTLSGITRGTGKIAYQKDETLVILDAERKTGSPAVDLIENVFPAYFEQTKEIIDAYRQMNYDNFDFSVSEKETVTVNGYEMCKFTGKHTYTVKDVNTFEVENIGINFVAYATQLKTNGAYVYWMVLDESEDQSLTDTIEDYAYKMALSLKES